MTKDLTHQKLGRMRLAVLEAKHLWQLPHPDLVKLIQNKEYLYDMANSIQAELRDTQTARNGNLTNERD